jgi:hypothetical protein
MKVTKFVYEFLNYKSIQLVTTTKPGSKGKKKAKIPKLISQLRAELIVYDARSAGREQRANNADAQMITKQSLWQSAGGASRA